MTQQTTTQNQIILHLATTETIDRLDVIAWVAACAEQDRTQQEEIGTLKDKLSSAQYFSLDSRKEANNELARSITLESKINEQHQLLLQAKALLQDWVTYNDTKKNADIAPATKVLLEELP